MMTALRVTVPSGDCAAVIDTCDDRLLRLRGIERCEIARRTSQESMRSGRGIIVISGNGAFGIYGDANRSDGIGDIKLDKRSIRGAHIRMERSVLALVRIIAGEVSRVVHSANTSA